MSSTADYADFVSSRFNGLDGITIRRMMGEYVIHFRGRVFGFLINDHLIVENVPAARKLLPEAGLVPLFPGSKDFIQADEALDNVRFLHELALAAYDELPVPKPRRSSRRQPEGRSVPVKKKRTHESGTDPIDPDIRDFMEFRQKPR